MSESRKAEDQEISDRNFRSSYYKSLGFKDNEKSITYLEALLKADIFDVKKLKMFCLKYTLTIFYRPFVWKVILSVIPVFSDNETCSFVREQKNMEFRDLKTALQVMGKMDNSSIAGLNGESGGRGGGGGGGKSSLLSELSFKSRDLSPALQESPLKSEDSSSPATPSTLRSFATINSNLKLKPPSERQSPRSVAESTSNQPTSHEHRTLLQPTLCTPRDFVTVYLLENNRLLSVSASQLKQKEQVNMLAIAEAFLILFEEESEDEIYWLFSNFVKKLESHFSVMEELFDSFSATLEDIDCALLEHIKDLDALDTAIPLQRWFCQCYARDIPESCLGSIWDRLIGGSVMILVYVAVGILLSNKRRIFSFSSAQQIEHVLDKIPQENFGAIVSKSIELWESHGSPLMPSMMVVTPSMNHELQYEIEEYT